MPSLALSQQHVYSRFSSHGLEQEDFLVPVVYRYGHSVLSEQVDVT